MKKTLLHNHGADYNRKNTMPAVNFGGSSSIMVSEHFSPNATGKLELVNGRIYIRMCRKKS